MVRAGPAVLAEVTVRRSWMPYQRINSTARAGVEAFLQQRRYGDARDQEVGGESAGERPGSQRLSLNGTGTSTHVATGSPPRRAGSKRAARIASSAVRSSTGLPEERETSAAPTHPSAPT